MAFEHVRTGPCTITFNSEEQGYSEDGADIRYQAMWGDVHSDDYGGRGGAPSDTQILGIVGSVTAQLTKYNVTNVQKLASFAAGGTGLILPVIGTFIRQEGGFANLELTGTVKTYNFAIAFPREPQSLNAGTKFSTFLVQFEFWINNPTDRQFQTLT